MRRSKGPQRPPRGFEGIHEGRASRQPYDREGHHHVFSQLLSVQVRKKRAWAGNGTAMTGLQQNGVADLITGEKASYSSCKVIFGCSAGDKLDT